MKGGVAEATPPFFHAFDVFENRVVFNWTHSLNKIT